VLTSVFSIFVETVIDPPATLTIESALTEGTQADSSYTRPTSSAKSMNKQIVKEHSPPRPFVKTINNTGFMRVAITRPIVLPTFSRFPEF
jgi:hypothetical protein